MHSHWHFFYGTSLWTQKVWTIYVDANPSPFKDDDDDDDDDDNDNDKLYAKRVICRCYDNCTACGMCSVR